MKIWSKKTSAITSLQDLRWNPLIDFTNVDPLENLSREKKVGVSHGKMGI